VRKNTAKTGKLTVFAGDRTLPSCNRTARGPAVIGTRTHIEDFMKSSWALLFVWLPSIIAPAPDDEPKAIVSEAVQKLAEGSNYSWKTVLRTEGGGLGGDFSATGMMITDGYASVSSKSQGGFEIVRKADKTAVLFDGLWMTIDQAGARSRASGGGFNPALITGLKLPIAQLNDLLGKLTEFKRDGDLITAELDGPAATELINVGVLLGGRRGPPGGRPPGGGRSGVATLNDVTGTMTFTVKAGQLTGFTIKLSGTRESNGNQDKVSRTATTTFSEVGSTEFELAPDAKEIVDALIAGRVPNVFVPEPSFKRLFNGHDLSGWAGRPEHWSVEDGAITGKTTVENPAKGNNFLIAKDGDKNLIVDDFELRFSYRILADNDAGFANSGMQYRSKDLGEFVVGGYQADFEAGRTFSGILYDEAGGAGGRGVMAERGELVTWTADGKKTVHGRLGSSDDIQAKIKPNDWNECVIIAQGNRLQHFINGVQTVGVIDETEGKRLTAGILALQLHAGQPMTVQCKDIRIKLLGTADVIGGANIRVAKDFKIELLYTVPRETEGSWVAMCLDPQGRLIVSDQNGALYRVTVPAASGEAVKTERINLDIGFAHGLLWAFDSLYVAVNEGGQSHGIYRVRDTDGDDQFDEVTLLRQVEAGGEHGLHSLVLSPDGKSIYVAIGNQSSLIEMSSSRVPLDWSEDQLLPRLTTGFMDDSHAPQGYISRMDPDGKNWELIAMGLRNEFDVAFNKAGELFTYDADMEWDIGEPWYRPTRVNHVISGAEFGFRNGDAKWPAYYLDSFGEVVNIGPGSPTGIGFGYGAKFPAKYQDALYLADWSFGKVRAVHLTPSGTSYTGEFEDFISGQPFPIVDFVIHPRDGSMLLVVGGRGAQSALYRMSYVGKESTAPSLPDTRGQAERNVRHKLESFHGHKDASTVETVWPYLSDSDRAIRYVARIALEWQDIAQWRDKAFEEKDPRKAIPALVALTRLSGKDSIHRTETDPAPDPESRERLLSALDKFGWTGLAFSDRVDLLRAYSLVLIRLGAPDDAAVQRLIAKFDPLFPTKRPELDALLARLLIFLEAPTAATKVVDALLAAPTQEEQVDLAVALRSLKSGWTTSTREQYFRWFTLAEAYRGGNTFASSLRTAKNEAIQLLSDDDKAALQPVLDAHVERKSPRDLLAARPFVKKWTLDELVPIVENGRNGTRNFERGRQLYSAVACSACHRFANEGGSVGPDLTGVMGRFSVHDLLESIVEPSKVISDQYQAITIATKDGRVINGRVGNLNTSNVNVIEDMFDPGRMTNVRRADIEDMKPSTTSMMPEGLLDTLTSEEIQDLMAYLLSHGDSQK
jgi:putative heme-binding domain-containing protein